MLRQDQPEAKISLVSTKQDNLTNLPYTDTLATTANLNKEEEKITWFLKLQGNQTWFTDTCIALQMMGKALTGQLMPLYNLRLKKRTCKITATDQKQVTINISMISAAGFALNC